MDLSLQEIKIIKSIKNNSEIKINRYDVYITIKNLGERGYIKWDRVGSYWEIMKKYYDEIKSIRKKKIVKILGKLK